MRLLAILLLTFFSCSCVRSEQSIIQERVSQVIVFDDEVVEAPVASFIAKLKKQDEGDSPIFVILRSDGGIVSNGLKMSRAIQEARNPVVCIVDERAFSMAFYILQSCDKRIMTYGSLLMMHKPYPVNVTPNENQKVFLEFIFRAMCEQMSLKMKVNGTELLKILSKGDVFFTWREAKHLGAVDLVVESVEAALKNPFKEAL